MFTVRVVHAGQTSQVEHRDGILEIGRGPERDHKRVLMKDPAVSRDHLQVEEIASGCIRVRNLSQTQNVTVIDGTALGIGEAREFTLPLRVSMGKSQVDFFPETAPGSDGRALDDAPSFNKNAFLSISPLSRSHDSLKSLGKCPTAEDVARWLGSVIGLQRSPADSKDFFQQTARALCELIDLELGMVLLRRHPGWEIAGHHATSDTISSRYSRTLMEHVVRERRTFYQDRDALKIEAASLVDVAAVVASPIFGLNDDVVGVLYGLRTWGGLGSGKILPLEAQIVQLLAGAVGDNLTRTAATRTRTQFEQFFSAELVRELERDPALLQGRWQDVSILVSDLRGFTSLSERLEPETTCLVIRDVMEKLTERIHEAGGVIVDYAGDGILAMWNAPVPQEDHVIRACRAGLAMLAELPGLNGSWQTTIGGPLSLGIGINTGRAHVGNTGSSRRLKYGPHGLIVNIASRVQDATKRAGAPFLVTPAVKCAVAETYETRSVGALDLKGISEPVELFALECPTCRHELATDEHG